MSGVHPADRALMGPWRGGTAYIPGLADFVPMVKGRGSMALLARNLVRAGDRRGTSRRRNWRLARALPPLGRG